MRSSGRWARRGAWSGLIVALGLLAVAAVGGCETLHSWRFGLGSMLRGEQDPQALEARRTAEGAPGQAPAQGPPPHWTEYRGPGSLGVYAEGPLALEWPASGPPRAWRVPVGRAYSSLVVAAGLVLTLEQRGDQEALVAFDLDDGRIVWDHAWPARFDEALSKEGPRATPAVHADRAIALGATGELRCVDLATGQLRWRRDLLEDEGSQNLLYGLSASPRLHGERVIVQGARSVWALDLATGEPRWRALFEPLAYSTPQLGEVLGRATVLVETAERVVGLDAGDGAELWSFPWAVANGLSCTQPVVVAPDRVLVSAGYGKGAQLVALAQGAGGVEASVVWRSSRLKTRFNEPVRVGGHVYALDEGTLACIDPADGSRAWKAGRYGYGQLLAAGDRLLVVDEQGAVHLLEATPREHVELRRFQALDGGMTLNVPALAHGRLLVRSDSELACFDLRPAPEEPPLGTAAPERR